MRTGTFKDRGHYGRKAAWLTVGVLLFIPHAICLGASHVDDWIMALGASMWKQAHPCLFNKSLPPRKDGKDW
jgi:hypothetical protein